MRPLKNRRRSLGLGLLAALCLTGALTGSALANWRVEGTNITTNQPVSARKHTNTILLVPALNLEVECSGVTGQNLVLKPGAAAEAEGKLSFFPCVTRIKGVESPKCIPNLGGPIVVGGKGHLILHRSRNYVLFEPNGTEPFTIITFNPKLCALPSENKVKGSLVLECLALEGASLLEKDCAAEEEEHILRQAPKALFNGQTEISSEGIATLPKDVLLFGANESSFDGTDTVAIEGINTGDKFSGTV